MASAGGAGGTLLQRVVLIDFVVQPQLARLVWKQNPPAWATNLVEHKVETVERTPHPNPNPTANRNQKTNIGLCKTVAKHSRPNLVFGPNFGMANEPQAAGLAGWLAPSRPGI